MNGRKPLRLRAADADDLKVIASALQDALVAVSEMKYLAEERRFVFAANRFRWEDEARERDEEGNPVYERVLAGVSFEHVDAVRQTGVNRRRRDQILGLLTVEAGAGTIDLLFSAGVTVRLEAGEVLCHVEDFGEPWPTQRRPAHPMEDAG
jgi:hypothetical protein